MNGSPVEMGPPGLPMGLSGRTVLRGGFGAIIALLAFSSVEAYRIQRTVSDRHILAYRNYVQRDTAISELRNTLSREGTYIRDFFINTGPEGALLLDTQLRNLMQDAKESMEQLKNGPDSDALYATLQARLLDFWKTVGPVPRSMLNRSNADQYKFLQREVVPRRNALYETLHDLKQADQKALEQSEAEFSRLHDAAGHRLILMLSGCLILAFLVARFSVTHAGNLERAAHEQYLAVAHAKHDLEQLSAGLVDLEERERKRLSRELHDEIGQALALVQIELSGAYPDDRLPAVRERIARAKELTDRTVQTIRNISLLLRPALLDDLGLAPALQWLLEDFMRRSGVACEFIEDGVEDQLPDSVKTCVFRVVQEAVHNCEKHAAASKLTVSLRQSTGFIRAEIEDNGCGFVVNAKGMPGWKRGLGMIGMRERAARLGGALTVDSSPGRGTRLSLSVPVPAPPSSTEALQSRNGVTA